ncbi:cytochrome P450 monooxygenase [Pluteus cervinus]|uniref:Cytochrome P450 monooxygenase n=1 Tax=Pluteus cervinus TaxID=181527 RepID=A0ACD3BD42_9AGAR|nr:cytochrome P450 monooxygenase [Pluteus cervinus]
MLVYYGILLSVSLYFVKRWVNARRIGPRPPGPPPLPVLGNLLNLPKEKQWETFQKWAQTYGDIVSLSVVGRTMILLNSRQEAIEMLEGKGNLYSDRPSIPILEFMGWTNSPALAQSKSQAWKQGRKFFHQLFGTNAFVARFNSVQERETRQFLLRMLEDSDDLSGNIRTTMVAIIMRIAYGYHVKSVDDPFVRSAEQALEDFSNVTAPGKFLVNLIPALKHMPGWAPGGGFKRLLPGWVKTVSDTVEKPHSFVKRQMALGIAEDSTTSRLLEENGGDSIDLETELSIKWIGTTMYLAAADTSTISIKAFFMAMTLFPECQKKAQAELDAVVGRSRLPDCTDRDSLPYVHALVLEVMRCHTAIPLGFPHTVSEDNIYKGYYIPRDSMIMPNIWAMTHDPVVHPDPMTFNPERFLSSAGHSPEPDPRHVIFGFGRRICPGRLLADTSVFLSCAMTLSVFDISPHMENGTPVLPVMDHMSGTISHPPPFKCTIRPRSEAAVALIHAS